MKIDRFIEGFHSDVAPAQHFKFDSGIAVIIWISAVLLILPACPGKALFEGGA